MFNLRLRHSNARRLVVSVAQIFMACLFSAIAEPTQDNPPNHSHCHSHPALPPIARSALPMGKMMLESGAECDIFSSDGTLYKGRRDPLSRNTSPLPFQVSRPKTATTPTSVLSASSKRPESAATNSASRSSLLAVDINDLDGKSHLPHSAQALHKTSMTCASFKSMSTVSWEN